MELVALGIAAALLGLAGLSWRGARDRARARAAALAEASRALSAHAGKSRWSDAAAFFEHEGLSVAVYMAHPPQGPVTGMVVGVGAGRDGGPGTLRIRRAERASVADYAARKKAPPKTEDPEFERRFAIRCRDDDRGFVRRWLDAEGRRAVTELARIQGEDGGGDTVVEYLAGEGELRVWRAELVTDAARLGELRDLAMTLAGALRPRGAATEPGGPGGFEV